MIKKKFRKMLINIVKEINNLTIRIPVPGLGCGVIGLSFAKQTVEMGKYASTLLKSLEYRGYDSTGAVIQDDKGNITLKKDVGAPSVLVKTLGIEGMQGKIFCGQVRWATFGAVTAENAQPHIVKCKKHIYGAHNGNITNTNILKEFLIQEGHDIISNNDGEMLVHTVEHYFSSCLEKSPEKERRNLSVRREAMKNAIIDASNRVEGSYAAVIVDPVTEKSYAIKAGSSLYAGISENDDNKFILISSDLTSILKYTKKMINLREGYVVEYSADEYQIFAFKDLKSKNKNGRIVEYKKGDEIIVQPSKSKLRAEDTELVEPYKFFMEQEINSQIESSRKLITFFNKGSHISKQIGLILKELNLKKTVLDLTKKIYRTETVKDQKTIFDTFKFSNDFAIIAEMIKKRLPKLIEKIHTDLNFKNKEFYSRYSNLFLEIIEGVEYKNDNLLLAKLFDVSAEFRELTKFNEYVNKFSEVIYNAWENHTTIYTISCGTSYNATKTAALFFNEISGVKLNPILPGNFRGQYSNTIRDNDIFIGVSQSGETKDLIDIFNDIDNSGKRVSKIAIVNNENSTLAQEKSDFYIPIKCGPEIAVPATKSYMNQVLLFYFLAIKVGEKRLKGEKDNKNQMEFIKMLNDKKEKMGYIPELIKETLRTTNTDLENMAESLFLQPSIHILATKISSVAEEGALKIRETVLNHTQGIEGSEFKHGPNTILGFNTIFGVLDMDNILKLNKSISSEALRMAQDEKLDNKQIKKLISDLNDYLLKPVKPFNISPKANKIFERVVANLNLIDNMDNNYPLIFVSGPEKRDVNLTISQINTHKIRGANIFVIAEENDELYENAVTAPDGIKKYKAIYVKLPKTDDTLLATFSSMVALQLLAFKMSLKKMKYLNKLHIPMHGVHPDVPKNVSKSITVD